MTSAAAHPSVLAAHARAAAELERYFDTGEDLLKAAVQSPQSSFEASMGALEKSRRHRMYSVKIRDPQGGNISVNVAGTDLGCGCDVHPVGSEGGGSYELDAESMDALNKQVSYFRRIAAGVARAHWPDDLAAPPAAPPGHVLRLRYREPLTPARAMFDVRAAVRLRTALDSAASRNPTTRERYRLMADSIRSRTERGPGNLAHLTRAAAEAFAGIRSQRAVAGWVDALGRKLAQPRVSAADRALGRSITIEAELLELHAVAAYRRAMGGYVPDSVRRAADRAG